MKITLNAIRHLNKQYGCAEDVTLIGVDALVEKIGAQLGAIDEVTELGPKYQGIIIAKIVSCQKHANADKLSVCTIDDGGAAKNVERDEQGHVQVVCGAPNVREGLMVAWLPPGATVPESYGKDPFVLEAREIRGVKSNGMLASPKELAISDSHAGILEIDGNHQPGADFAQAFKLADEVVFDIENKMFTHRPDCFGWLGIDRELAGIQGIPFQSPSWYTVQPEFALAAGEPLPLKFENELPQLVPRFTAITMSDVKVGASPVWLQVALAKVGQRPINNIVDLTNFLMLQTGQPLHAYDYDKLKAQCGGSGATIVVRNPKPGEKLTLLNGKTLQPRPEAIMIATATTLIGLGGVMGGADTEVDENTRNLIIECANFDMYSVRRTSMAHGLFTDAVTRFNKGQSPLQNLAVLAKMAADVTRLTGGRVAGAPIDDNHLSQSVVDRASLHPAVDVDASFINDRLGSSISAEDMAKLLTNVEFAVTVSGESLSVQAPFWRTDIELREDVVEEIGRLYGYSSLPLALPRHSAEPTPRNPLLDAKTHIRNKLSAAGANEVLTYSFQHGNLLDKVGQDKAKSFELANALSPDLQYYRLSLMPSLLEKVHPNIKAGYDEFALFELGKTHSLDQIGDDGVPAEFEFTGLVVAAADKLKKPGAAYYQARKYLSEITGVPLEFKPVSEAMQAYPVVQPYDLARSALVSVKGGDFLGIIGEFKPSVRRALKLPRYSAGFEADTQVLQALLESPKPYVPLPRFPKVSQDITLKVPSATTYQDTYDFIWKELIKVQPANTLPSLTPIDIYHPTDSTDYRHLTFRFSIASYERTMTDSEVSKLLDAVAAAAPTLKAERV